jgi:hypothetical protein
MSRSPLFLVKSLKPPLRMAEQIHESGAFLPGVNGPWYLGGLTLFRREESQGI